MFCLDLYLAILLYFIFGLDDGFCIFSGQI